MFKKKMIAALLTLVMMLGILPVVAFADNTNEATPQRIEQKQNVTIQFEQGSFDSARPRSAHHYTFTMPYDGVFNFTVIGACDVNWYNIHSAANNRVVGTLLQGNPPRSTQHHLRAGDYTFKVSWPNDSASLVEFSYFVTPARDINWTGTATDRGPHKNNDTAETAIPIVPDVLVTGNVNSQDITADQRNGGANEQNMYKFTVTQKAEIQVSLEAIDYRASARIF